MTNPTAPARNKLAEIVLDDMSVPLRVMGATVSFLRMQARSEFERQLADKLDRLIVAEVRAAQGNPNAPSPPVASATFVQYDGLPEPLRKALFELETFIGDVDGKDTVIQVDEHTCIDDGTIDAEDAVKAFNTIVAALIARENNAKW